MEKMEHKSECKVSFNLTSQLVVSFTKNSLKDGNSGIRHL